MGIDDQPAVELVGAVLVGVDSRFGVITKRVPCASQQMSFFFELRNGNN